MQHLIKRNKNYSDTGVLDHKSGLSWFTETRRNGTPAGYNCEIGETVWVAESGYAIYGKGVIKEKSKLYKFKSINDFLRKRSGLKASDDKYAMNIINKIFEKSKSPFKYLGCFEIAVDLEILERPIEISDRFKWQSTWYIVEDDYQFEDQESTSSILTSHIPSALRSEVYYKLSKVAKIHAIDVDHFVPKSLGGPGNIIQNLVPIGFSINRYKSNRVPKGLFVISNSDSYQSLNPMVPKSYIDEKNELLEQSKYKDATRKIIAEVNSWEFDDLKKFYYKVLKHHHPEYAELLN